MCKLRERFHKTWRSLCKTSGAASRKRLMQTDTLYAACRLAIACVQTLVQTCTAFYLQHLERACMQSDLRQKALSTLCPTTTPASPPQPAPDTDPISVRSVRPAGLRLHFGPSCLGRRTQTPFRSRRWPEGYVVGSPFLANALLWGYLRRTKMRMPPPYDVFELDPLKIH